MKKMKVDSDKIKEEKEAIARTYKDYITTFEQSSRLAPKTFVKSSTLYADKSSSGGDRRKGELYTPKPLIPLPKPTVNLTNKMCKDEIKGKKKKSSNLESLGNELKLIHRERMISKKEDAPITTSSITPYSPTPSISGNEGFSDYANSTNLFLTCMQSNWTEKKLIKFFGVYGPLASVKILWPRSDEERNNRSLNYGFVAFMSRKDAERALIGVQDCNVMKVSWGKGVKLPAFPIFIPDEMKLLYGPPPPTGLPFNAQIINSRNLLQRDFHDDCLINSIVRVTIPLDRTLLMLIHRMIEFIVREGPSFEAFIMTKERNNPFYDFLRNFQSPEHIYYRWKLYSILLGESKAYWSMEPFRMFAGGSIWLPPAPLNFKDGMPAKLSKNGINQAQLDDQEIDEFISILRNLDILKKTIAKAMAFCLKKRKVLEELFEIFVDSFRNVCTKPTKKIARLYLLSDLLINCVNQGIKVKDFNDDFRNSKICTEVFQHLHETGIFFRQNSQQFDNFQIKVLKVLRSWNSFHVFDANFLTKLENVFFTGTEKNENIDGIPMNNPSTSQNDDGFIIGNTYSLFKHNKTDEDLDGVLFDQTNTSHHPRDSFSFTMKRSKTQLLRKQNKFDMFCPYDNNANDGFMLKK